MSDDAEQVMGALESLLKDTVLRSLPGASTVAFDLDGDRWCLDPRRRGALLVRESAAATLTIRCSPALLARLLTEPDFYVGVAGGQREQITFEGDPRALAPLVQALQGGKKSLDLRLSGGGSR